MPRATNAVGRRKRRKKVLDLSKAQADVVIGSLIAADRESRAEAEGNGE